MRILTIVITLMTLILSPLTALCLERLSAAQMKEATAQSGVSMAFGNVVMAGTNDEIAIINSDNEEQFISFKHISTFTTLNTGNDDYNGDGYIDNLEIDIFNSGDQALLSVRCNDLELRTDYNVEKINFCGTDIGSIAADNFTFSSFHMYLGAHKGTGGSGIDAEFGTQVNIDSITYQDNSEEALVFSNILMAGSITYDDVSGTYKPKGEFTFGSISNNPVTIDIAQDKTSAVRNGFIALNLPMQGSVRIDQINYGGSDPGTFKIDNLIVNKLYIEIPGRGLGH